jgi:hypothetical protein
VYAFSQDAGRGRLSTPTPPKILSWVLLPEQAALPTRGSAVLAVANELHLPPGLGKPRRVYHIARRRLIP